MAKLSIRVAQKTKGRPRTTGITPIVGVRLSIDIQDALDRWALKQGVRPSRSEAIRQILIDYLKRRGFLTTR